MSQASLHVTDADFDVVVVASPVPVLVDFWAERCPPCHAIAPVLEDLARQYQGQVKVAKVDVDSAREVSERFGIRAMPTLLLFKQGRVIDQLVGAAPRAKLEAFLRRALPTGS